ncbi:hypothetical protein [Streptomyces sp. NPDC000405]|uniref:hypothetical protein n=1 Tax=Streptomyces sp. NPDC000405 TaxID=3161033 RepID=UPI00398CE29F
MGSDPETLFVQLIKQKGWRDHRVFKARYSEAARELAAVEGPPSIATARVEKRSFDRWCGSGVRTMPRREARRILGQLFPGIPAERLFAPTAAVPATAAPSGARNDSGHGEFSSDMEDVVMAAAGESARFAAMAEASNVGPYTIEQLEADIRRIVRTYPNRPVGPLFQEVRELRDTAFRLLEGRQPPQYSRNLYFAAGVLCGVLANASFDLGRYEAAETQARAAFLCGELAEHNGLRSWIRGLQALIAYWDGRPADAVRLAEAGGVFVPESGTAQVRLAAIKARALGQLGKAHEALAALHTADMLRERVTEADDLPGGMMAFPAEKGLFYASSTHLWLGGPQHLADAERRAEEAVAVFSAAPPEQRRIGEESLARMDLALARLGRGNVEGAADQVHFVLSSNTRRHTESVTRRLGHFSRHLGLHPASTTPVAIGLGEAIAAHQQHLPRALPSGESA